MSRSPKGLVLAGIGLLLTSACTGVAPYDYQATADELKPNGGLFSGPRGELVIYRRAYKKPTEPAQQPAK